MRVLTALAASHAIDPMNARIILLHAATATCTGLLCLGLHEIACPQSLMRVAHPGAAPPEPSRDAPISSVQERVVAEPAPSRRQVATQALPEPEPGDPTPTVRWSRSSESPSAPVEPEDVDPPVQEQVRAQVDGEEALERQGLCAPSAEWLGSLDFLANPSRRADVEHALIRFDRSMRDLQRAYADGIVTDADFAASWEALTGERENQLLKELLPEERQDWHATVGGESEALRQLPTDMDDGILGLVAAIREEFAVPLEDPGASAEERTALLDLRDRRLREALEPEQFERLKRAEDPRYGSFVEMTAELQLPQTWADYLFDYERYFSRAEWVLDTDGTNREGIESHLRDLAAVLLADIRGHLASPQVDQLLLQPQVWFLLARPWGDEH